MSGTDISPFSIGPALVGPGRPVYVIAEAGVNHNGRASIARELIHAAADAEADAVKFQVFSADRLVTRSAPTAAYQQQTTQASSQYEMLKRLELSHDEIADLAVYAGHCGVEFLATPFSVEDLRFLVSMGIRAIKLASTDIVNAPLLDAAAGSGLPIIASTGAADFDEVLVAVERLGRPGAGPLALLHCVSSYPTPESEANLAAIRTLASSFGCVAGFSDHTESLAIGGYAVAAGACIIEKHMTMCRTMQGPDHAFSLEPDMMARYIRNIRHVEQLLGDGTIAPRPCEQEVRTVARGCVVAACDIRPGDTLTDAMLTIKRAGCGIPPSEIPALLGHQVTAEVPADSPLVWEVVS